MVAVFLDTHHASVSIKYDKIDMHLYIRNINHMPPRKYDTGKGF